MKQTYTTFQKSPLYCKSKKEQNHSRKKCLVIILFSRKPFFSFSSISFFAKNILLRNMPPIFAKEYGKRSLIMRLLLMEIFKNLENGNIVN